MPSSDLDVAWPLILEKVSGGMPVASACKLFKIPRAKFYERVRSSSAHERDFATALADRAEGLADEIITLADERPPQGLDGPALHAWANRQRLRVDVRRWCAAKMQPKRYGDAMEVRIESQTIDLRGAIVRARKLEQERLERGRTFEGELVDPPKPALTHEQLRAQPLPHPVKEHQK